VVASAVLDISGANVSNDDQSGGIVHVRGHSRGGPQGTVDVSAYDRSPPGDSGAAGSGDRVWERFSNSEFRQAIAQAEHSAEHYNHGYRQYNEGGGGKAVFGRYQLRKGVLVEAGWMDKLGRWTEKAASNGVKNDVDFFDRPEAQEQAMTDALRVYDSQARALGLDRYVGQTIKDTTGSPFRVSRAGIIAAGHRAGTIAVKNSLQRMATGKRASKEEDVRTDRFVAKRLREFEDVAYEAK
jgi:hypothetical protein